MKFNTRPRRLVKFLANERVFHIHCIALHRNMISFSTSLDRHFVLGRKKGANVGNLSISVIPRAWSVNGGKRGKQSSSSLKIPRSKGEPNHHFCESISSEPNPLHVLFFLNRGPDFAACYGDFTRL